MNLCLATYQKRLASLLENASGLHFFALKGRTAIPKGFSPMPSGGASGLLLTLHTFDVDALVCGAVSTQVVDVIQSDGFEVYAWIGGDIDAVIQAMLHGQLDDLRLPGCPVSHKRAHRLRVFNDRN